MSMSSNVQRDLAVSYDLSVQCLQICKKFEFVVSFTGSFRAHIKTHLWDSNNSTVLRSQEARAR